MREGKQAILIVDDRPQNLLALEEILKPMEAQLAKASSGEDALAATLSHEFALAILDVQMPGMDGYELAELLRGNPETKHVPIVFLTAASCEEDQIFRGYESGAVDYIVKPYNPTVLISKVRVFLELHAQKAELKRQRKQLEAVNHELEAFAYSVSHDLRAPLRAIEGLTEALLEDYPDKLDDKGQDYLRRTSSEARRMGHLINDLLSLSRISCTELRRGPVNISDMARDVVGRLREADPGRTAEVQIANDLTSSADPNLLKHALENLLSNAWKFTAAQAQACIVVDSCTENGQEVFFVRDNGVGFDMTYAEDLFAPFWRLHRHDEFSGTGIGLSIVQRIVARHGGSIWFESEVGEGTTFYFTLDD